MPLLTARSFKNLFKKHVDERREIRVKFHAGRVVEEIVVSCAENVDHKSAFYDFRHLRSLLVSDTLQ